MNKITKEKVVTYIIKERLSKLIVQNVVKPIAYNEKPKNIYKNVFKRG